MLHTPITAAATYRDRASRIVDRVLPALPAANPLYDPEGFVAGSRRHGERQELYWLTFARLRAKAEGGRPYLTLPKDCPAIEDGAMARVAKRLSDAELVGLSRVQNRVKRLDPYSAQIAEMQAGDRL
jgi:hypothetical protein